MIALTVFLAVAVATSSALPVKRDTEPAYGKVSEPDFGEMSFNHFSTFLQKYNTQVENEHEPEQGFVFGGFGLGSDDQGLTFGSDQGYTLNGIQNTDDASFSDADFDWQKYLDDQALATDEGSPNNQDFNQLATDTGSFDMQKYIDQVNQEMEDLGLNE